MLIKALCDYYDILFEKGRVLPSGYSKVNVHYLISLTESGQVDEIIDCQKTELVPSGKKMKEKKVPVEMVMPLRTEKPGIDANIIRTPLSAVYFWIKIWRKKDYRRMTEQIKRKKIPKNLVEESWNLWRISILLWLKLIRIFHSS